MCYVQSFKSFFQEFKNRLPAICSPTKNYASRMWLYLRIYICSNYRFIKRLHQGDTVSKKTNQELLKLINLKLRLNHFQTVTLSSSSKACFDIIAKKGNRTIILKIEPYIDNFNREKSFELKSIAQFLEASPIIVGTRGRRFKNIDEGLVLLRYGIPVVSPETLESLIAEGIPPIVYCSRGGYFVNINRKLLRRARMERNYSYTELAHLVGVARSTVYEYEHNINPPPEIAARLENVLETSITEGIPIFEIEIQNEEKPESYLEDNLSPFKEEISSLLENLGVISQFWTHQSPFDAFGEHQSDQVKSGLNVLVCVDDSHHSDVIKRINTTVNIASLAKRRAIMIVDEEQDNQISQKMPTFTLDELQQMQRAFELVKKWAKKQKELKLK